MPPLDAQQPVAYLSLVTQGGKHATSIAQDAYHMKELRPRILHFHLTTRCPFSCRHCCSDAGRRPNTGELDLPSIRALLEQAARFGMEEIDVSGGEPLIIGKDRLLGLLHHASSLGLVTSLNTNAWLLDEQYLQELKEAGLDRLKSSLYGTCPSTHDAFTGKNGSFHRLLTALERLKDSGIEVWVHYVVTPANLDEALGVGRLLDPYGVDTIQVGSLVPSGRAEGAQVDLFEAEALGSVVKRLASAFEAEKRTNLAFTISLYPDPSRYPFRERFCDYLVDRLVVDPSGSVLPCCLLPERLRNPAGNLLHEGLEQVLSARRQEKHPVFRWLARGHKAMRRELNHKEACYNLCATCIEMLTLLAGSEERGPSLAWSRAKGGPDPQQG